MANNLAQPNLTNLSNFSQPTNLSSSLAAQPAPNLNLTQAAALSSSTDIFQELASQSSFSTSDNPQNPLQLPTVSNSLLQGQGSLLPASLASPLLPPHSSLLHPPPFLLQPDASMWEGGGLLESAYEEKLEPFQNESKGSLETSYEEHSFETGGHEEEESKVAGLPMASLSMWEVVPKLQIQPISTV